MAAVMMGILVECMIFSAGNVSFEVTIAAFYHYMSIRVYITATLKNSIVFMHSRRMMRHWLGRRMRINNRNAEVETRNP